MISGSGFVRFRVFGLRGEAQEIISGSHRACGLEVERSTEREGLGFGFKCSAKTVNIPARVARPSWRNSAFKPRTSNDSNSKTTNPESPIKNPCKPANLETKPWPPLSLTPACLFGGSPTSCKTAKGPNKNKQKQELWAPSQSQFV